MNGRPTPKRGSRLSRWSAATIIVAVAYVLSSGPVIAAGFWLREATHRDGFYAVMWLYYPLLAWGPDTLPWYYVEWWVDLFGTVGPG